MDNSERSQGSINVETNSVGYYIVTETWTSGLPIQVIDSTGDLEGRATAQDLPDDINTQLLVDMTAWNSRFLASRADDEGWHSEEDLERHLSEGRALAEAFMAATESTAPVQVKLWAMRVKGSSTARPAEEFGFRPSTSTLLGP